MNSNRHRLTRSYAVSDLSVPLPPPDPSPPPASPPLPPAPVSRPQPKKRGRPPKSIAATAGSTASSGTAANSKQALSAGNGDISSDEDQPITKKPKVNDNDKHTVSSLQLGKRGSKKIPPRSPLPVRSNRVLNPGAPDKKNTRRTSAQVAAEKKRKVDLQRNLDALAQRQIEILAEMEVAQEAADEDEDRDAVRTLADVETIEDIDDIKDIEMSEAISDIGGSEYCSDTEKEITAPKKVPAKSVVS
jgi:hypothetical protein